MILLKKGVENIIKQKKKLGIVLTHCTELLLMRADKIFRLSYAKIELFFITAKENILKDMMGKK